MRSMLSLKSIILRRRSREMRGGGLSIAAKVAAVGIVLLTALLGAAGMGIGRLYLEVTRQVPAVEDIEAFFDAEEAEGFQASVVEDRSGRWLFSLSHPSASERKWVGLTEEDPVTAPDHLVQSLLVSQDPTFWQNAGYLPAELIGDLSRDLLQGQGGRRERTVTEQLVAATLLPVEDYRSEELRQDFRLALLAERLTERFDKAEILTWYLNAAHFGQFTYGVDTAALAYFGKHADGLSVAESATLAALAGRRTEAAPTAVWLKEERDRILEALAEQGAISRRRSRLAREEPLGLREGALETSEAFGSWRPVLLRQVAATLGADYALRGGLTIRASLDQDLQRQAECALRAQADRLAARGAAANGPARDGSPCLAAGLLPPIRPGRSLEGAAIAGSVLVLDPSSGEILALAGDQPLAAQPVGSAIHPFLYLSAFSRGFSPGTMVLDLPLDTPMAEPVRAPTDLEQYHGPVRMRTALLGRFKGAAARTLDLAGRENVLRTLRELGVLSAGDETTEADLVEGLLRRSTVDLAAAYGIVANEGVKVGAGNGALEPTALRRIEDRFGREVHGYEPSSRVVLSEGLAHLLLDVLTDSAAREQLAGRPIDFDPGLLAGLSASGAPGKGSWAVGFSPDRVTAVWLQVKGIPEAELAPEAGAVPISSAVLQYASRELSPAGWSRPAQVVEVEVCDPSGLLPTEHCPQIVTELYLQGTEPTAFDNLYQPFEINRETGQLATLQTPLGLVEERVYMIPPPEASEWADAVGLDQPPTEYDTLAAEEPGHPNVRIASPAGFEVLRGEVWLRGEAHAEDQDYFRLQFGEGLNPSRWTQIGEDSEQRVESGRLAQWDTGALSGLYTVQLVVVLEGGGLLTDSVAVTVDNQAPGARLVRPASGERLAGDSLALEASASDSVGVDRVLFYLDGEQVGTADRPPYVLTLPLPERGEHEVHVAARDTAGNLAESEPVRFFVGVE